VAQALLPVIGFRIFTAWPDLKNAGRAPCKPHFGVQCKEALG
jgi:hypothetical protein